MAYKYYDRNFERFDPATKSIVKLDRLLDEPELPLTERIGLRILDLKERVVRWLGMDNMDWPEKLVMWLFIGFTLTIITILIAMMVGPTGYHIPVGPVL